MEFNQQMLEYSDLIHLSNTETTAADPKLSSFESSTSY